MRQLFYPIFAPVILTAFMAVTVPGCSSVNSKSPDVRDNIRASLDQAGLKDVSVRQDRDKGVLTLSGKVPNESDKSQAESLAKNLAAGQVVANQIEVLPTDNKSDVSAIDSDLDGGIKKNLNAELIQNKLQDDVKYDVKNAVVTLTGNVRSQPLRQQAEKIAASVPNVRQVVNEIQVKDQKATSRY